MVLNSPVLSHLLHHSRSSQILWTLHSSNPKCHLISSDFIWYFIWYFQWPKGVPGFDTKILRAPGQRVHDRSVHPNQVEGSGSLDPKKKDPGDDKMTKWSSGCVKRWFSYDMIDMVGWKWWYLLALVAIFNLIYIYHYISYNILLKFGMILRASYDLKLTMNGWHSIPKTIPRVIRMQTLKRRWTNTIM